MRFKELSDNYLLDIVCLFSRTELAHSISLVSAKFYAVSSPFLYQYGAYTIKHVGIYFGDEATTTGNDGPSIEQQQEFDRRPISALISRYIKEDDAHRYQWEPIVAQVPPPPNVRHLKVVEVDLPPEQECASAPTNTDLLPAAQKHQRNLFFNAKLRAFFTAFGTFLQERAAAAAAINNNAPWMVHLYICSVHVLFDNCDEALRTMFACFLKDCQFSLRLDLFSDNSADDKKRIFESATRTLLRVPCVNLGCTSLVYTSYTEEGFCGDELLKWLHYKPRLGSRRGLCICYDYNPHHRRFGPFKPISQQHLEQIHAFLQQIINTFECDESPCELSVVLKGIVVVQVDNLPPGDLLLVNSCTGETLRTANLEVERQPKVRLYRLERSIEGQTSSSSDDAEDEPISTVNWC